jgi:hypothetical protein
MSTLAGASMKQPLSGPQKKEPSIEISPEAEAAMRGLKKLFSDPAVTSRASFRCNTEGLTEIDVMFESIIDEQYGYDPNSEYERWVRRLYELGLISELPDEWE